MEVAEDLEKFDPNQPRDQRGRWSRTGKQPTDGSAPRGMAAPITAADFEGRSDAITRSRPVTLAEYHQLAAEGSAKLGQLRRNGGPPEYLNDHLNDIVRSAHAAVQEPWGGVTVDTHDGTEPRAGSRHYALTIKSSRQESVSIPIDASEVELKAAVVEATRRFSRQYRLDQAHIGIFRDDDLGRIDIDPVLVVDTLHDVETIGAFTGARGGAYYFGDGNGYWPPYVAEGGVEKSAGRGREGNVYLTPAQLFAATRDPDRPLWDGNPAEYEDDEELWKREYVRDARGRFAEVPGSRVSSPTAPERGAKKPKWSPTMTRDQAELWAADSVIQDVLTHTTGRQAIGTAEAKQTIRQVLGENAPELNSGILDRGFKPGASGVFGGGIYLGREDLHVMTEETGGWYDGAEQLIDFQAQSYAYGTTRTASPTLRVMVDVRNPLYVNTTGRLNTDQAVIDALDDQADGAGTYWQGETWQHRPDLATVVQQEGFDSIVVRHDGPFEWSTGGDQVIVYDPARVTVLVDEAGVPEDHRFRKRQYVRDARGRFAEVPGGSGRSLSPDEALADIDTNTSARLVREFGKPMAGRLAAAFHGFSHGGLTTVVTSFAGGEIRGDVLNKHGEMVGTFGRSIRPRVGIVDHDYFELDSEYQGRGFTKAWFDHAFDQYRAAGITRVAVDTADVGSYAWAKLGARPTLSPGSEYDVESDTNRSARGQLWDRAAGMGVRLTGKTLRDDIDQVLGLGHSRAFELLESTGWIGMFDLETNPLVDRVAKAVPVTLDELWDATVTWTDGVAKFDPDQPRDARGRWSRGSGLMPASLSGAEKMRPDVHEAGVAEAREAMAWLSPDSGDDDEAYWAWSHSYDIVDRMQNAVANIYGTPGAQPGSSRDDYRNVRHILRRIATAEPDDTPLYRGMNVESGDPIRDLMPGDEFDMNLSAFSPDRYTAQSYGSSGFTGFQIRTRGPVRSFSVENWAATERVTAGRFRVTERFSGGITVEQIGTFADVQKFDPNQPRDGQGRWTRSGGGTSRESVDMNTILSDGSLTRDEARWEAGVNEAEAMLEAIDDHAVDNILDVLGETTAYDHWSMSFEAVDEIQQAAANIWGSADAAPLGGPIEVEGSIPREGRPSRRVANAYAAARTIVQSIENNSWDPSPDRLFRGIRLAPADIPELLGRPGATAEDIAPGAELNFNLSAFSPDPSLAASFAAGDFTDRQGRTHASVIFRTVGPVATFSTEEYGDTERVTAGRFRVVEVVQDPGVLWIDIEQEAVFRAP